MGHKCLDVLQIVFNKASYILFNNYCRKLIIKIIYIIHHAAKVIEVTTKGTMNCFTVIFQDK